MDPKDLQLQAADRTRGTIALFLSVHDWSRDLSPFGVNELQLAAGRSCASTAERQLISIRQTV